jgi:hypothetical protein
VPKLLIKLQIHSEVQFQRLRCNFILFACPNFYLFFSFLRERKRRGDITFRLKVLANIFFPDVIAPPKHSVLLEVLGSVVIISYSFGAFADNQPCEIFGDCL